MRTCRLVYSDMVDRLYGQSTISLFGKGVVGSFARMTRGVKTIIAGRRGFCARVVGVIFRSVNDEHSWVVE